jgi:phage tail-like protein
MYALAVSVLALVLPVCALAQPWPPFAVDPGVRVKIGDERLANVVSVEGPLFTTQVVTFRDGGGGVRKAAGPSTAGDIIVRRNVRTDDALWNWYQQVLGGDLQRKDISVIFAGPGAQPGVRFDLTRCFPSAYALHAGTGALVVTPVEAVTISCEGVTRTGL